ncbi:MAG: small multi-drug export protein [Planctomycetota bacterium]
MSLPIVESPDRNRRREFKILLVLWLASLVGIGSILALWVARSPSGNLHYVWILALGLATLPGKLTVFGGLAPNSPLDPWEIALLSVAVDGVLALGLALGLTPILKLPGVGAWLRSTNAKASEALSQYPRLKRMAFWGTAVFVALPVPGSGWVGGSFAAQLLGLSRLMGVAAIVIGSAAVSAGFAGLAVLLGSEGERILRSPWIATAGLIVLLVVIRILWKRFSAQLR